tara:strand:+ start:6505 stop:7479 length:975 start_codon:yes stop_codon:yes gene_type:complete
MVDGTVWDAKSIGVLTIEDADGDYGVGMAKIDESAADAADRALNEALLAAGCPGEVPEMVWIFQAPGAEEEVISGLRRSVGDSCPIVGGSAADNTVEGNWMQIGPQGVQADSVVIGVLFTSGGIGFSFQSGYETSGPQGIATRCDGRTIHEIDGVPAAQIYNDWTGGQIADKLDGGGAILADTTMCPISVGAGETNGIPRYRLIHPEAITADGGLSTFATVEEGARIHAMRGDREQLIGRAGKVAREAAEALPRGIDSLAGGLMVYCAGCCMAVGEEMDRVALTVADSFSHAPYLGCFTFGEQGPLVDRNVHGNLMISAIAFGS